MNALVKPRVEDSTGDSFRASRSSSIARGCTSDSEQSKQSATTRAAQSKALRHGKKTATASTVLTRRERNAPIAAFFLFVAALLTTKSGSRMPNWIALTRLTGADEYGKRSSVAIERRGPVCRRLSLFGASLAALLLSLLLRRCQAPRKGSRTCARACMRRARAAAERRRRDGHERARCLVFFLFFCSLSLSLSSRRWAAEVNRGCSPASPSAPTTPHTQKTSAVKKHEGSAFSSWPRRCKRALRVPFSSQEPLLDRLPALPKRDGRSESIFVEKFARKRRPSIVFFPALSPIPSSFFARPPSSSRGEHAPLLCLLTALSLPDPRRQHNGRPRAHDPAPGGPHRARGAVLGAPRLERAVAGRRRRRGAALRAGPARGAGPAGGREGAAAASDTGRRGAAHPWLRRVERRSGESFLPFSFFEFSLCLSFPLLKNTLFLFPFPPDSFPPKSTIFSSSSSTALWDASEGAAGGPQCWAGPGSRGSGPRTRGACPW